MGCVVWEIEGAAAISLRAERMLSCFQLRTDQFCHRAQVHLCIDCLLYSHWFSLKKRSRFHRIARSVHSASWKSNVSEDGVAISKLLWKLRGSPSKVRHAFGASFTRGSALRRGHLSEETPVSADAYNEKNARWCAGYAQHSKLMRDDLMTCMSSRRLAARHVQEDM